MVGTQLTAMIRSRYNSRTYAIQMWVVLGPRGRARVDGGEARRVIVGMRLDRQLDRHAQHREHVLDEHQRLAARVERVGLGLGGALRDDLLLLGGPRERRPVAKDHVVVGRLGHLLGTEP